MRSSRRDFLKSAAACAAGSAFAGCVGGRSSGAGTRLAAPKFMWAYLAHFGMKMWERRRHYPDLKVDAVGCLFTKK